jgi:hypothetical protein
MSETERVDYWNRSLEASNELGEAFARLVAAPDPLAQVRPFS